MGRRRRGARQPLDGAAAEHAAAVLARAIFDDRLDRLEADGRVGEAAFVAYTFHIDPAVIVAESDPVVRLVRLAAARLVNNELKRRAERSK